MHHLQRSTQNGTTEVAVGVPEASTEAVEPAAEVAALGNGLHLILVVGDNLRQFGADELRIAGLVTDTAKSLGGTGQIALLDEVTRRLGQEKETGTKDESPGDLDTDGDAVGAGVGAVLGGVVDAGSQHQTNGDAELVTRNDGATDLAGRNLGHVQDNDGRNETDTKTGNQTADHEQSSSGGSSLKNDTDNEDSAAGDNGSTTTKPIGQVTSDQSAEESTSRQNGSDQRLLPGRNDKKIGRSGGLVL